MNVGKRILILGAFGIVFAILLVAAESLFSPHGSSSPLPETKPPERKTEEKPSPNRPSPLAQPSSTERPQAGQKRPSVESAPPAATDEAKEQKAPSLQELFLSDQPAETVVFDLVEVEGLLKEHVDRNLPRLKLSDADYERLAKALQSFREGNLRMRSMERTKQNSAALKQAIKEVTDSTIEFKKVTGMSPGEFLSGGEAPVQFGSDRQAQGKNDEIVTEYLPDPKP